ncbi:carph-isopro domain-containing protein [Novosphingobium guangzhouense]|uniref:Rha family transcriptional regulator n=1 Tax=Novosphingobium guangzhouense TaxID=1850347 RepID=A0A2K2FUP7_9SPHN|nr:hypothetical protein [Novosphingobium guangzhouense]PNU02502.1 hypothetical protein A8V01_08965 [Novosphingobium guangzhouense]
MNLLANIVIDHLGGSTAVAKMIEASKSTVHSWRKNGIPHSRMAHLRLAARAEGKPLPDDLNELRHASGNAAPQQAPSTGQSSDLSGAEQAA